MSQGKNNSLFPLMTVGIVVLNREWIIGEMLNSLQLQTYPHNRIFVIVVDGGSTDGTVQVAKSILEKTDFAGYEVLTKKCNIPEGRNICIEKMKGDLLFFWDSDVIMGAYALQRLADLMSKEIADIMAAEGEFVYVDKMEEMDSRINALLSSEIQSPENRAVEVVAVAMGYTLVSRKVLQSVQFDADLTSLEDYDFSARAREKGFRIMIANSVRAFDINVWKQRYSDIHIDSSLGDALRGLRKKARANVLACGPNITFNKGFKFFLSYRRYVFYLGYIPALLITIYGLITLSWLSTIFLAYLILFAVFQIRKRGFMLGIKAASRSVIVGLPYSLMLAYYFGKYALKQAME